jgi:hypothetical protein
MRAGKLPACAGLILLCAVGAGHSGVVDPDCTAKKAVQSAAAKATIGVGGRCGAAEAATDTLKDAVGIEQKGPIEKQADKLLGNDDDGLVKKTAKKIID